MDEVTVDLPDGSAVRATTSGSGPGVLLPVRSDPHDPATAASMRQWGADPDLGPALIDGLADRFRVVAVDYEGHRMSSPAASVTPRSLVDDLLAVADATGLDSFAYFGYSWLALTGLQLAVHTDRLGALAMGGFPPVDGPYGPMSAVTRAAHQKALQPPTAPTGPVEPGDWDAAGLSVGSAVTGQFVALYDALQDFDDAAAADGLTIPRLAFAGSEDTITYGPGWGDTVVDIGGPLQRHRDRLIDRGWQIEILPGLDHMSAVHADRVLPILRPWLERSWSI